MLARTLIQIFLIVLLISGIISCRKITEGIRFTPSQTSSYRIETIDVVPYLNRRGTLFTFYYNELGDPEEILNTDGGVGSPNVYFKYDDNNRLIEIQGKYADSAAYEKWMRFGYSPKNQIIKDTSWIFGQLISSNPDPNSLAIYETSYAYDAMGRIVKTIQLDLKNPEKPAIEKLYTYNEKGNLINTFDYDNKISFLRAHPLWMFLGRDYSKNNRAAAREYTSNGLPSIFRTERSVMFMWWEI
ncbi:MAG: hypothetical protein ACXWV4_09790, partial [Flavitalea sp.]